MVKFVEMTGYEEFAKYAEAIDPKGRPVLMYFTGEKLPSGESWCIDCVVAEPVVKAYLSELDKDIVFASVDVGGSAAAEPVVKAYLSELDKDVVFAFVDVGDKDTWRDKACPFRTDPRLKLMVIPTLIHWKGVQRLEGSQCAKRELLQMLFEDED